MKIFVEGYWKYGVESFTYDKKDLILGRDTSFLGKNLLILKRL